MTFVLDSSVALAWCFEDERTDTTDALLQQTAVSGLEDKLLGEFVRELRKRVRCKK